MEIKEIKNVPAKQRGGARAGAGRPAQGGRPLGSANRTSIARTERAQRTGQLPSEGMLSIGRICEAICNAYRPKFLKDKDDKVTGITWTPEERDAFKDFARLAADCYGKAAPYFEQRFATLAIHGHLDLSQLTDEEVFAIEATYKRINGTAVTVNPGGSREAEAA